MIHPCGSSKYKYQQTKHRKLQYFSHVIPLTDKDLIFAIQNKMEIQIQMYVIYHKQLIFRTVTYCNIPGVGLDFLALGEG